MNNRPLAQLNAEPTELLTDIGLTNWQLATGLSPLKPAEGSKESKASKDSEGIDGPRVESHEIRKVSARRDKLDRCSIGRLLLGCCRRVNKRHRHALH